MSTKAAENLRHPPGLKFRPDDDELIEFFLLPSVRGEPAWFPGVVIIEDDSAANTLPWKLLNRHGLDDDNDAYFFVHTNDVEEAARQDRYCVSGGRWVSRSAVPDGSCMGGERIEWRRVNLNLHMGRGKSGRTGWVMHECTLTQPPCPFLKICHVSFSGHGKGRTRVPDGDEPDYQASKRALVDAAAAAATSGSSTCVYGSTATAIDQGYGSEHTSGDLFGQLMVQETGDPTYLTTILDQDPRAAHASAYQQEYSSPFPIHQGVSPSNLQLPDGTDLPTAAMPCMELEERAQTIDQEIQDAQLQPVQSSTWSLPFAESDGADQLYLEQVPTTEQQQPMETSTAEPQYGGDQQEQQEFWSSIRVDTENIVFSDMLDCTPPTWTPQLPLFGDLVGVV